MTLWTTVLLAGLLSYAIKLVGHLVPHRWLEGELVGRVMTYLPVALLAALVAVQTFTADHGRVALDARAAGLGAAILALLLRAPFIVVIVVAAATAAVLRAVGWAA